MRAALSWIRELLEGATHPLLDDVDALASALTMRGVAVEAIERPGAALRDVVVARVLDVAPHPNADRLRVCRVDDGTSERQVVCGAPNVRAGCSYPFIRPGGTLPDGRTIEPAKLRGVTSEGMLMSARECGFGDDHAGILELQDPPAPGSSFVRALALDDAVFEFELTMNRPDCMGVTGLAREVAAACGLPLPALTRTPPLSSGAGGWAVRVDDAEECPRYTAALVRDVGHVPTPAWMVRRLEAHGLRSLGLVVDITNYVLLETGHPTHAFDADRLRGGFIHVRRARDGESLTTLDGVDRTLARDMLVIADAERPVALAGVMGGHDTEVTEATRSVLVESALFAPLLVRRTAKGVRLSTDASRRFERGMDPLGPPRALARVTQLLCELAGGRVDGPATDTAPSLTGEREVAVRPARINALLGLDLSRDEMRATLASVGFGWSDAPEDGASIRVPSPRVDVHTEADIAEEVGRTVGYERIPVRHANASGLAAQHDAAATLLDRVRDALVFSGCVECVSPVLVSPADAEHGATDEPVLLSNALGRESSALRTSLVPGVLRIAEHNRRVGLADVRLFEIGTVFTRDASHALGVRESTQCAIALAGARAPHHPGDASGTVDRADIAGLIDVVCAVAGVDALTVDRYDHAAVSDGTGARYGTDAGDVAFCGPASHALRAAVGCDVAAHIAWIDLDALVAMRRTARVYVEPSRYPAVKRDVSLVVPDAVSARDVRDALRRAGGRWLMQVDLFDVYRGDALPRGTRSLAYALTFQSAEGTLGDAEIDKQFARMTRALSETLGVTVRDAAG